MKETTTISHFWRNVPYYLDRKKKMVEAGEEVDTHELNGQAHRTIGAGLPDSLSPVNGAGFKKSAEQPNHATLKAHPKRPGTRMLRGHFNIKGVWYQAVTTARVTDRSLLPSIRMLPPQNLLLSILWALLLVRA